MGYMPVITNLAAPLIDYATRDAEGSHYKAVKFSSFSEMGQALRQGDIDVGFMIAPLPIVLRQQGEKIKVVMIGTRHESTWVVRKDLHIKSLQDLVGKKVAVPLRFSGHNLAVHRLMKEQDLLGQIDVVEMNPPDMAAALASGVLDSYFVGEPFAAKTIMNDQAEVLYYVEDLWPDFMCNVMAIREELIELNPELVQKLVQASVSSLAWAQAHPVEAIQIASGYWNQSPELALYAISHPPDRVRFDRYVPVQEQYQQMADFMVAFGLLGHNDISGLVEDRFAKAAKFQEQPATDLIAAVGRRH